MAKKQKGKVFWVTRTNTTRPLYRIWSYQQYPRLDGNYYRVPIKRQKRFGHFPMWEFCATDFETFTGITLAPGERIRARLVTG